MPEDDDASVNKIKTFANLVFKAQHVKLFKETYLIIGNIFTEDINDFYYHSYYYTFLIINIKY